MKRGKGKNNNLCWIVLIVVIILVVVIIGYNYGKKDVRLAPPIPRPGFIKPIPILADYPNSEKILNQLLKSEDRDYSGRDTDGGDNPEIPGCLIVYDGIRCDEYKDIVSTGKLLAVYPDTCSLLRYGDTAPNDLYEMIGVGSNCEIEPMIRAEVRSCNSYCRKKYDKQQEIEGATGQCVTFSMDCGGHEVQSAYCRCQDAQGVLLS